MIPAQFDYVAPTTSRRRSRRSAEHGDDAKIIAGGQSLLPVLRMRLNAPEMVIDLGKIDALRGVRDDGDAIVIGAMTTHADVLERRAGARERLRDHQGDRAARRPAGAAPRHLRRRAGARRPGRRPRCAGARARRAVRDRRARRRAHRGGRRLLRRPVRPPRSSEDEILKEVRIPKRAGWGAHYEKFVRVAHQWPIVAVAAAVKVDGGTISEARVGLTNMGSTPLRARSVEEALVGPAGDRRGGPRGRGVRGRGHQPALGPQRRRRLPQAPRHRADPPGRARRCGGLTSVELKHTFTVPASVAETWAAFEDIESVAGCFPGATVTEVVRRRLQGVVQGQARSDRAGVLRHRHVRGEGRGRRTVRRRGEGQGQARQRHRGRHGHRVVHRRGVDDPGRRARPTCRSPASRRSSGAA